MQSKNIDSTVFHERLNESKKKELTDKKKEDIENNFNLSEKEYKNIEQKIKKVQSTFNELDRKENNKSASYYIKKIEIEGLNANYIELYANFKDIKEDLIAFLLTNDKETTDLKAKENALQKTKGVQLRRGEKDKKRRTPILPS